MSLEVLLRLGAALLAGSVVGFERQWHQKMAGLRTNALVSLGAAGFVVFATLASADPARPDMRIAAQIVSGIGFLGAGVILRDGINVHGLNTAATLWCSAMLGCLAGAGFWAASGIATVFVVLSNLGLRPIVRRLNERLLRAETVETHYTLEATCRSAEETRVRALVLTGLAAARLRVREIESEDVPDTTHVTVTARAIAATNADEKLEQIAGKLVGEPFVFAATWTMEAAIPES